MAGYIGSKTSVTQVDGYNRTDADAEFVNDPNSVISVSGSNVGIGTTSPSSLLDVDQSQNAETNIELTNTNTGSSAQVRTKYTTDGGLFTVGKTSNAHPYGGDAYIYNVDNTNIRFATSDTERMRIDSSGNVLVGKTTTAIGTQGSRLDGSGRGFFTRSNSFCLQANRLSSHGNIIEFLKDGSTVGSIGTNVGRMSIGSGDTGVICAGDIDAIYPASGISARDNAIDLGTSGARFDDIYATNGTIQTSDRNEKQDIEALSDAEQRVAVACKGLLRKFRWIDAVAEKGDDARIHFGIIAQDLQDAFAAEGLDAGRYAMFISSTWWETQTEVPAVEAVEAVYEDVIIPAVLDEDGNEVEAERIEQQLVTEAVEAKEAYTRTDTYETLEEAPEGATERTRLGVRYPELLAFIIGAM